MKNDEKKVNGYSEEEVDQMVSQIETKVQEQTNTNEQQMSNGRQKYENAKTSKT